MFMLFFLNDESGISRVLKCDPHEKCYSEELYQSITHVVFDCSIDRLSVVTAAAMACSFFLYSRESITFSRWHSWVPKPVGFKCKHCKPQLFKHVVLHAWHIPRAKNV